MGFSASDVAAMASLLTEELREIQGFIDLLRHEQDLLVAVNIDELMPLVEAKTGIAARLAKLSDRRERLLAERGLAAGRPGMEAAIAGATKGAVLAKPWEDLLRLAGEARQLNELSGQLIVRHMQHNRQALDTLMSAAGYATTYGPDGQSRQGGGGRSLGNA